MSLSCLPQGVPAQRFLHHPSGPLPFLTWHLIAVSKNSFDIRTDLNLNKRLRESYLEGSQDGFINRQGALIVSAVTNSYSLLVDKPCISTKSIL